ncbi:MAG: type IVB secretion system coupling complex protein DotM/IcmP [Legionella sp.]
MAQQSQQQSGNDNSMAPVWITVLLFLTGYLIWSLGHQYIVTVVFYLNILQAKLVHLFTGGSQLQLEIDLMQTVNPADVSWEELLSCSRRIGYYVRYPVVALLILLAILLYRSDITLKFRRAHDMKTLRMQEQHNWSSIMPVVKQDLVSTDINEGPWAMALTPMEFARKYQLLKKDDLLLDNLIPGQEMTAGVRRSDAKRVFTLQLGPYWEGFEHCPPHVRALAAVFMARMNRDRKAATHILESINKSYAEGKPDYSVANNTLRKYQNTEDVQIIVAKHAYLLTVLASLLQASRDDGVMPSAEFLWLKPTDRRLWYMLNCVGRQTPFAEVGGAFAHWRAEIAMGRPLLVPMIDEAIRALEIAIKEVKLSPKQMQELQP